MPIEKNQVVLFHYSVRDDQGNAIENSRGGEPNAYLHGHGGVIRGLEEALEGRDAGDTFSVTVSPEKAYGPRTATRSSCSTTSKPSTSIRKVGDRRPFPQTP
tara:strand:- start:120 stop:425 length:306 start_codon:yes stop_codon:yes gene_type:complete